jgi:ketosteroid isomerase-like protein
MKKSAALLLALLIILLATACASAPATAPTASEASVREAMNGFMAALNALDTDRMATFFADDITAFVPLAQADRVDGKPAVVEIFRKYVERTRQTTASTQLAPEDLKVDTSGDTALVTFNIRSEGSVLRRTFVFRRQGGRWLIVHFHASNFKPS